MPDVQLGKSALNHAQHLRPIDFDFEPLDLVSSISNRPETPCISPTTQTAATLSVKAEGLRSPSSSIYSCSSTGVYEQNAHPSSSRSTDEAVVFPAKRHQSKDASSRRRASQESKLRDSGVEIRDLFDKMQYEHPLNRLPSSGDAYDPIAGKTVEQGNSYAVWSPEFYTHYVQETGRKRLSTMFVFGQDEKGMQPPHVKAVNDSPGAKKKRWSTHFRFSKSDLEPTTTSDRQAKDAADAAEMRPPKRSRFGRFRQSVSEISASLKQIAGRKRSREELEELAEDERALKVPRNESLRPEPPKPQSGKNHTSFGRIWCSSPPSSAEETRALAFKLRLEDPEVRSLIPEIGRGPPVASSRDELDILWTCEERVEFGAYVRAAEDDEWTMNLD